MTHILDIRLPLKRPPVLVLELEEQAEVQSDSHPEATACDLRNSRLPQIHYFKTTPAAADF